MFAGEGWNGRQKQRCKNDNNFLLNKISVTCMSLKIHRPFVLLQPRHHIIIFIIIAALS